MAIAMRHMGRIWRTRSLLARRACVAACLAGTVASGVPFSSLSWANDESAIILPPAVIHAVVDDAMTGDEISQVVGKQPEPRRPSSSQAANQDSFVAPAGGIGNWFGGQTKRAKKEHEDGRKATALPPPDPSTVDWSGVPYHQPKSSAPKDTKVANEPIRDAQRGNDVPSSTANLRRSGDAATTPSRAISATRSTNKLIPTPPMERAIPSASATGSGLQSSGSQASSPSSATNAPPLSASSSTRRSGRRAFETADVVPRNEGSDEADSLSTESAALTEGLAAPSVSRRELMPLETTAKVLPRPSRSVDVDSIPQLPPADSVANDSPSLPAETKPKSALEESWNTIGSGVRPSVPATSVSTKSKEPELQPIEALPTESDEVVASEAPSAAPSLPPAPPVAATVPTLPTQPLRSQATQPQVLRNELATVQSPAPSAVPSPAPSAVPSTTSPAGTPAMVPGTDSFGPSAESERALREQLTRGTASSARRMDTSSKLLASSESPGVRVVTEGPSEIMIRELTQYEVRVENRGSFEATGIVVRSSLPTWAEVQGHNASIGTIKTVDQSGQAQLQWTIDKLPAGVVERLFVRVKAVKAGTFDVATDWTLMPQKHVAKINVREPKLAIVIDGPEEIIYGRSEKYRVRVMNPGDGDASNVVFTLSPESKSPQSQKIGSIPAGKEAQFEIELTARELGELKIGGIAVADREVKSEANKSIRIAAANVEAELTGPPLKYQNSEAKYHLIVTNTGKAVCESLNAELRLPMGVKYVSGIEQATVKGDLLTWKIDALQPGAIREYDLTCKMDRTGEMVISFNCNGSAAGRASVSINTLVEAIADLVLSISDPAAPAPVNTDVIYEMTITNRGSKAAEDVRVVAQFSNGIEPIRVEGHTGEVLTGQALFNPIARIEPGTTVRLKVTAKADRAGDHRFRAEVRHGETSLMSEEATVYMNAPAERISRRSTDR